MTPLCSVQKYGITVPLVALAGMVNCICPVNRPVSNCTPATAAGVNEPGVASLVTECCIASWFTTVTVAPGGTSSSAGE